jgi:quinoprotein glucose dehydrogenase
MLSSATLSAGGIADQRHYGGHRKGSNLFANSCVCVDLETGKRIWHTQITHHDIWNYDLPSAPALVNMIVDGRPVKALVQLTKQGYAYVLNRVTGQPVWPFEERPAPASDVPGEHAWPTQPHPTKPAPYEYQGYNENDLIDFTPELRAEASASPNSIAWARCFTPPSESSPTAPGRLSTARGHRRRLWHRWLRSGTSLLHSDQGGAQCGVAAQREVQHAALTRAGGAARSADPQTAVARSWRSISAGQYAWSVPLSTPKERIHAAAQGKTIPNTGGIGLQATMLITKTLLIAGEGWGSEHVVRL